MNNNYHHNWYKLAQETQKFKFEEGQTLTYNYPKIPYRGTCVVTKVNPNGTIDVLDHSGRYMYGFKTYFDKIPIFKEMI